MVDAQVDQLGAPPNGPAALHANAFKKGRAAVSVAADRMEMSATGSSRREPCWPFGGPDRDRGRPVKGETPQFQHSRHRLRQ